MTNGKNPFIVFRMPTIDAFLSEIDDFLTETGWADATFSRRAVNDGKFVGRLRGGAGVTIATVDRVRDYITEQRKARRASTDAPDLTLEGLAVMAKSDAV